MFDWIADIGNVTQAIQLALAPAFLLTGIAAMLSVMTHRLARIIDRGRYLNGQISSMSGTDSSHVDSSDNNHDNSYEGGDVSNGSAEEALPKEIKDELGSLEHRRHAASLAISMSVLSALLVCSVVSVLFLEALFHWNMKWLIGTLFTGSTMALVIGLASFLREVHIATRSLRILPRR